MIISEKSIIPHHSKTINSPLIKEKTSNRKVPRFNALPAFFPVGWLVPAPVDPGQVNSMLAV